jgi:YidC/Oxa1 family membrane protein insertase
MQKNLVIALVLSAVIYLIWFTYIVPPQKPQLQNQEQIQSQTLLSDSKPDKKDSGFEAKKVEISGSNYKKTEKKILQKEALFELKNDKARYVFNSDLSLNSLYYQSPVETVDLIIDKNYPFLSVLPGLNYKKIAEDKNSITVLAKKDIEIIKSIVISKNNDMNTLVLEFKNNTKNQYIIPPLELSIGPGLNTVKSEAKENTKLVRAIYSYQKEGRKNPVIEKLSGNYNRNDWLWAAMDNRYFLFAVMNDGTFDSIKYFDEDVDGHNFPRISLVTKEITVPPMNTKKIGINFYSGPKDYSLLKSFHNGLHLSIDFGFFAPLAKLFDSVLKYFYKLVHNYGVAIILLGLLVQILMLPLSVKSYKAMAIMKKMQPEMKSIQDRYKKDPQRMNMELMQLYKRYGANPFSGCWPLLIQIPIFFALFTTLRNSWNLHGAGFVFWIKDLSAKDPYYILPILMGALMFLQNYTTPQATTDKTQAAMMKWMPVIFTFMFLAFPSGLVIYWIVNSLFSIVQNYYLRKTQQI